MCVVSGVMLVDHIVSKHSNVRADMYTVCVQVVPFVSDNK